MKAVKKDPPRKPIYVTDPKDKRLVAYNDSLKTYNLAKPYVSEAAEKVKSAKTKKEFDKISYDVADKYMKAGMNPSILKDGKTVVKTQHGSLVDLIAKKPTRPVFLKKAEDKKELPKKATPAREPIYVTDPNHPRLKAYQDSSRTYNLYGKYSKELLKEIESAKTKDEYTKKHHSLLDRYVSSGMNTNLLRESGKVEFERNFGNQNNKMYGGFATKPVQPVVLAKEETKVNIAPRELSMPKPSIKINRTVKLPETITGVKYDTQKGNVIVGLTGKDVTMPRKEFDSWVNKPENRKMFDDYRKAKAKK